MELLENIYFGNPVSGYLVALAVFVGGTIAVRVVKGVIVGRIKTLSAKTETTLDDFFVHIFERAALPLLYFGVFYLSLQGLALNPSVQKAVNVAGVGLVTYYTIRFVIELINYFLKSGLDEGDADAVKLKGIVPVLKVVVWALGITFLLDNLGFEISTVIAGLGIGGIAIAMASQQILGELFSYFSILFDKPFEIGDFIIIGDYKGTIEHIGIKTSRLRSLGGEQLVFSNSDLTGSRIRNYKQMDKRRVVFKLGVTYQTPREELKAIPGVIAEIIEAVGNTTFDRTHFSSYGDSALIIEIVYYVLTRDYAVYMDVQQDINLGIHEEFEKRGIEFAYPTQTVFIKKEE